MSSDARRLLDHLKSLSPAARVAVAWSGGVDSTVVAMAAARVFGRATVAVAVDSVFVPERERAGLEAAAAILGCTVEVMAGDPLSDAIIRSNGPDRCYRCKKAMIALIKDAGAGLILDGTNGSDDEARPGLRALREAGVVSPLRDCGLTKPQVREIAREWNAPEPDKPSESCLATRVVGTGLSRDMLRRIDEVEDFVLECGFDQVRVRVDDLKVIVEVPRGATVLLEQCHDRIRERISREGWTLAGYNTRGGE